MKRIFAQTNYDMDLNIITLEITDQIVHFDHYDTLVSDAIAKGASCNEEQTKLRQKSREHLVKLLDGEAYYSGKEQLAQLIDIKQLIKTKLETMKPAEMHEVIEVLKKDAKKMKKLYKSCTKK